MKFVTFQTADETSYKAGLYLKESEEIIDLHSALRLLQNADNLSNPNEILRWIDMDQPSWEKIKLLNQQILNDKNFLQTVREKGILFPKRNVKLLAPVPRPGKVICVGLNYRDHAIESNLPIPEKPLLFSKFPTSIIGANESVIIPLNSTQVDYEAELAVVIGRRAKFVSKADAPNHIFGYANFNDVSARDWQFADGQWQRGKSSDTFAPFGEFIATNDEIEDPHNLQIQLRLNGKTMQNSNTNQLIFNIWELIEFISPTITLEPGDVIATGTPPGVGFARKPPVYLKTDDVMEVEIEGLGILSNKIKNQ